MEKEKNANIDDLCQAIIKLVFEDVKGCARMYYYYVVDNRRADVYIINDYKIYDVGKIDNYIKKCIYSLRDNTTKTLIDYYLNDPEKFVIEYFDTLKRLYPEFTKHFKEDIVRVLDTYKEG